MARNVVLGREKMIEYLKTNENVNYLRTPQGTIYGFATPEGDVYIDTDVANTEEINISSSNLKKQVENTTLVAEAIVKNNGNPMSLTSEGIPSKLYEEILTLEEVNGDITKADVFKAQVYSSNFKDWFGDWQSGDRENVSKVVDENGEPLLVYHGSPDTIETFSELYAGDTTSNNDNGEFYFSDTYAVAEDYSREGMRRRYEGRSKEDLSEYEELSQEDIDSITEDLLEWIEDNLKVIPSFLNMKTPLKDDSQQYSVLDVVKTQRQVGFVKNNIDEEYEFTDTYYEIQIGRAYV